MLKASLSERRAFISPKPITFGFSNVASLDNLADRMVSNRRWIIQVSDLSTVDGSVLVYHGCNG